MTILHDHTELKFWQNFNFRPQTDQYFLQLQAQAVTAFYRLQNFHHRQNEINLFLLKLGVNQQ
jgi:hypothetical protein